jgi:hypothetical protein
MPDDGLSEQRPERCPDGHLYVDAAGSRVIVGWEPRLCTAGHTGHRSYWCQRCRYVLEVPPCVRAETGTSEVLGLARPRQRRLHEG